MTEILAERPGLPLVPDHEFVRQIAERAGTSFELCYQCGTCSAVCPFTTADLELPRREMLLAQWGLKGELMADHALWVCTTCGNCARLCPRGVDIPATIGAIREVGVLENVLSGELQTAFEATMSRGNPLGEPARKRADWTRDAGVPVPIMSKLGRPVDVLLYVECYWSFHPRGMEAAQAMARTLHTLGVDYAILGTEERCVADSQRAAGETGLFEEMAAQNIRTLGKYEFAHLVTPDPHAFDAFRKRYPALGGEYDVSHYTQLLADLLPRMDLKRVPDRRVTFHDPCYLGRHNGEYDAPRRLIEAIPGLTLAEMAHCRENALCCGGGGGGVWNSGFVSGQVDERLAERRVREALAAEAEVLVVSCPFEVSLFEDAVKLTGNQGRLEVRDIVELLDESLRA